VVESRSGGKVSESNVLWFCPRWTIKKKVDYCINTRLMNILGDQIKKKVAWDKGLARKMKDSENKRSMRK